jgi:hypothetical protein
VTGSSIDGRHATLNCTSLVAPEVTFALAVVALVEQLQASPVISTECVAGETFANVTVPPAVTVVAAVPSSVTEYPSTSGWLPVVASATKIVPEVGGGGGGGGDGIDPWPPWWPLQPALNNASTAMNAEEKEWIRTVDAFVKYCRIRVLCRNESCCD